MDGWCLGDVQFGDLDVDARAAKAARVVLKLAGGPPAWKWLWNPTQSMGTPRDLKSLTMR